MGLYIVGCYSEDATLTPIGQFFDHGLDLVKKGGNGTVYIPLQPDDPLYDLFRHFRLPHPGISEAYHLVEWPN